MAREILFKAKRIDNEEWVEGSYLYCEKATTVSFRNEHYILVFDGYGVAYHEVDRDTLCQYTGLTDNNGNKIWENDIVGFLDVSSYDNGYSEYYCTGQVKWDEETLSFEVTERLSCESYEALGECEVIGNIFDNPELLEGGA